MKMKKIAIIYMCLLSLGAVFFQYQTEVNAGAEQPVVIPDDAIRLRILANSNAEKDQVVKRMIRDEVNAEITKWVSELTSIEKARQLIQNRLPELEKIVAKALEEQGIDQTFTVDYGSNVKFPTKMYGNYIYPAGKYEAILITLGEGKGANWWCVLFPPLCFLDFSNGQAVKQEASTEKKAEQKEDEVEVKFFVAELFSKLTGFFSNDVKE